MNSKLALLAQVFILLINLGSFIYNKGPIPNSPFIDDIAGPPSIHTIIGAFSGEFRDSTKT